MARFEIETYQQNPLGLPRGAVRLDENHPLHGYHLENLRDTHLVESIDVPGGITFAGKFNAFKLKGQWAVGFNMAHPPRIDGHCDFEPCFEAINRFAEQLKNLR